MAEAKKIECETLKRLSLDGETMIDVGEIVELESKDAKKFQEAKAVKVVIKE